MSKIIKYQSGAKSPSDKKPTEVFFKPEYPYTEPSGFMYSYYHSPNHRKNVEKELYTSAHETRRQVYDDYPSYLTSDVGDFIRKQLQRLKTVKRKVGEYPGDNYYFQNTVTFVDPGAISHELAHATQPDNFDINNQFLKLLKLYKADGRFNSTAKNHIFNEISDKNKSKNTNALLIEHYLNNIYNLDPETHDLHPDEVRSDIYQLRQDLYRSGIFDARTQKFNKEHLKHAKGLYDKDATLNRLFKAYSDEDLIDLMNSVVENTNTGKQNDVLYAQNGTTLTGPTIIRKKYPKGTIVTNDPNDPRLQAYKDSLAKYNRGEKWRQMHLDLGTYPLSDFLNSPNVPDAHKSPFRESENQPIGVIADPNFKQSVGAIYKKPTQPVVYEDIINRIQLKRMPTPTITPNERIMPDVIYKDNNVPNAAYNKGMDIYHSYDSLGRWAAQFIMSTVPGIRGRISTPHPAGNYIIKYALGGPKTTNYPTKSPEGKIIHERKEVYTKEDAYPWEELTEEGKFRNKPYYLPNLPDDNPFQKHNTWMRNWIRRRPEQLKTISRTPDKLLDETMLNLAGTKFKDSRYVRPDSYVGNAWGQYMPGNHSIHFPTSIRYTDETTVVHELGHASKLGKRANSIKIINNVMSKDTKLPTFKSDDRDYYLNPDEVYSRIWELRKDLDFQPAEKIDKKILMDKYKKSTKTNALFDYLNEDSIVTLLNDLVSTGIIKNRS